MIYNPSHKASTLSNYSLLLDWQQRWFIKLIKTDVPHTEKNNQPGSGWLQMQQLHTPYFWKGWKIDTWFVAACLKLCACDCLLQKSEQLRISLLERQISPHRPCCSVFVPEMSEIQKSHWGSFFFFLILNWVNILCLNSSIHGIYVILVSTWSANVMLNHLILMETWARGLCARACVVVYMCTGVWVWVCVLF